MDEQGFTSAEYFWPRPSAVDYGTPDVGASGASNLGPTNDELIATIAERAIAFRDAHGLALNLAVDG